MTQINDNKDTIKGYQADPNVRSTIINTVIAVILGLVITLGLGFYRYNTAIPTTYTSSNSRVETRANPNIDTSKRTDVQNTATTPDTEPLPKPVQKVLNKVAS